MNNLLLKVFFSFVVFSQKYNKWGGRNDNHAVWVLVGLFFAIELSMFIFFAMVSPIGRMLFVNKLSYLLISLCMLGLNFWFWNRIKLKFNQENISYTEINTRRYFFGVIVFVLFSYLLFLFTPIIIKVL